MDSSATIREGGDQNQTAWHHIVWAYVNRLLLSWYLNLIRFISNLVRHSAARVIAAIASIEVSQGTWNQLLPFLQQTCSSDNVLHREVGSYILFTVLERIVVGFQDHLPHLFQLFGNMLNDPQSIDVRVITVRSLGEIAQFIDTDDKIELVSIVILIKKIILNTSYRNYFRSFFPLWSGLLAKLLKVGMKLVLDNFLTFWSRSWSL